MENEQLEVEKPKRAAKQAPEGMVWGNIDKKVAIPAAAADTHYVFTVSYVKLDDNGMNPETIVKTYKIAKLQYLRIEKAYMVELEKTNNGKCEVKMINKPK